MISIICQIWRRGNFLTQGIPGAEARFPSLPSSTAISKCLQSQRSLHSVSEKENKQNSKQYTPEPQLQDSGQFGKLVPSLPEGKVCFLKELGLRSRRDTSLGASKASDKKSGTQPSQG